MTLLEEGEPTIYPRENSRQTGKKMGHIVRENELVFWERGLEAGMFDR